MIIKKEKKGNVDIIIVDKDKTDEEAENFKHSFCNGSQIKEIIKEDADVYTNENKLLLKFRKNVLSSKEIKNFYDNIIRFASKSYTTNRGTASGTKKKFNIRENPKVYSNVLGYIDIISPKQKYILKKQNKTLKYNVRECRFNMENPEKFEEMVPLIRSIDKEYKKLLPEYYRKQRKKANETHFKIPNTSFTTITTNYNFRTGIHKDKGDDDEGFGNLSVITKGEYDGAETCFPQYGIGVDVRNGDILFMDVHEWHGNMEMKKKTKDAERLSIVCYLRKKVWENTRKVGKKEMMKHNKTVKNIGHREKIKEGVAKFE